MRSGPRRWLIYRRRDWPVILISGLLSGWRRRGPAKGLISLIPNRRRSRWRVLVRWLSRTPAILPVGGIAARSRIRVGTLNRTRNRPAAWVHPVVGHSGRGRGSGRRSNYDPARHRPDRRGCPDRRLHGRSTGPGSNELALFVDELRALSSDRHGTHRWPDDDGPGSGTNVRTIQNLNMVELVAVDDDSIVTRRAASGEVIVSHRGDADVAVDVGHVGDIHDIYVVVLHVNAPALADVGAIDLVDRAGTANSDRGISGSSARSRP